MSPPRRDRAAPTRRFLLETTPAEGPPRLLPEETEHALRVLRVGVGDRIVGLDGRGHAWPLEVAVAERRHLELRALGDPVEEPPPGAPGATLPWIELHAPLPRGGRAEQMVDRLTQLGLSRLVPLVTARCAPHAREVTAARLEKLRRTAREAIKQCGRLWLPEIAEARPLEPATRASGTRLLLDERAGQSLAELLSTTAGRGWWTQASPLVLFAGPEGGLAPAEVEGLRESGVEPVRLAPYTLRIETAAEAAVAVVANVTGRWVDRERQV